MQLRRAGRAGAPRSARSAALLGALALVAAGCNWTQWGGDLGRSGATSDADVSAPNLAAFVAKTALPSAPTGQVAVAGRVAFVVRDGSVTALDQRTDALAWTGTLPAGTTVGTAPAVDLDAKTVFVVVGGAAPALVGFDVDGARNCNIVLYRCSPTFFAPLGAATVATPPLATAGKVLVAAAGTLQAFDARGQSGCVTAPTGSLCTPVWSAPTGATAIGVGPAASESAVYAAGQASGAGDLRAWRVQDGAPLWRAPVGAPFATATPAVAGGTVVVPAGSALRAFAAAGCGAPSCAAQRTFTGPAGSPTRFVATPTITPGSLYATSTDGRIHTWALAGCAAAACTPSRSALVESSATSRDLRQSAVAVNGLLVLGTNRAVAGADRAFAIALDVSDLREVARWDLGAGGMGPQLASASVASGTVYVPTDHSLATLRLPPPRPLTSLAISPASVTPAFSPSTYDYALPCAAGGSTLTVNAAAAPGGTVALGAPTSTSPQASLSASVAVPEGGAIVLDATDAAGRSTQYWVRCLPRDFPLVTARRPSAARPTPGWYMAGSFSVTQSTPASFAMILDANGTPVWYRRADPGRALDVKPLGPNRLAVWGMANRLRYDLVDLATGQDSSVAMVGQVTDGHELLVEPNGNRLLMSYDTTPNIDLAGVPAIPPAPAPTASSPIQDCILQELDPQGNLLWSWKMSDHVAPKNETTLLPVPTVLIGGTFYYDVFHCNSIDVNPRNGNVLVSARHLNAVLEIRKSDGRVLWKMGGTPASKDGAQPITVQNDPYGGFVMQHDARYSPTGSGISLFDNQVPNGRAARAVDYTIDFTAGTAQPVFSYTNRDGAGACCLGSNRPQLDGDRVIGWGALQPSTGLFATELDRAGNPVLDLYFPPGVASYRVVKTPPSMFDIDVLRRTSGP